MLWEWEERTDLTARKTPLRWQKVFVRTFQYVKRHQERKLGYKAEAVPSCSASTAVGERLLAPASAQLGPQHKHSASHSSSKTMTAMESLGVAAGGRLMPLLRVSLLVWPGWGPPSMAPSSSCTTPGKRHRLKADLPPCLCLQKTTVVPQEEHCASKLGLFWTRNALNVDELWQARPTAVLTPYNEFFHGLAIAQYNFSAACCCTDLSCCS